MKPSLFFMFATLLGCGNSPQTAAKEVVADATATKLLTGTFHPRAHQGTGRAHVEQAVDGAQTLVFEADFATINGPRLEVYLSALTGADGSGHRKNALRLGPLQGVTGEQAYDIPEGTQLSDYHSVIVWCEDFSVLFTIADLE